MGVYQVSDVTVLPSAPGQQPERANWVKSSASMFNVLGFSPAAGQLFLKEDNHQRQPQVVVLSHRYWMRRFGGDAGVIGRSLSIEGFPVRVIGVLKAGQELPEVTVDMWAPAWVDSSTVWNNHTWSSIARLRSGASVIEAQRELASLTARMEDVFTDVYRGHFIQNTGFTTKVVSLRDSVVGEMLTRALWTLFAAVGLVLLIATANVANLFLARLDARSREVAVRTALGADRSHLAMHYLAESLLLTSSAAALAVLIAYALLRLLVVIAPNNLPRLEEVHMSAASIAFAVAAAAAAGLMFGIAPLFGRSLDLSVLREGGRGLLSSRRRMNARRILVAMQMALAVILLAASTLMVRTFRNLRNVKPGFDPAGVMTLDIALPEAKYGRGGKYYFESANSASSFFEQLADRVRKVPGITMVGFSDRLPLISGDWCTGITIEGPTPDVMRGVCPADALVSPGYFETMGIGIVGRSLTWNGMDGHDGGAIVSRGFADHYWPGQNPIGKGFRYYGTKPPFYHVVGVAEDVRSNGVDAPPVELVYFPILPIPDAALWSPPTYMSLVARGSIGDAGTFARVVARIAAELEPQAAISNPRSMDSILSRSVAKQSFTMALLALSAIIAILLAAVGLYGLISYSVSQRRGEIGVRMALGAESGAVTGMVLAQSMRLAIVGIVIGLGGAMVSTRLLSALLFGVQPNDALTLTAVPLFLLAIVILAAYAPARRAARVDPVEALRGD
jgi:predicted permease